MHLAYLLYASVQLLISHFATDFETLPENNLLYVKIYIFFTAVNKIKTKDTVLCRCGTAHVSLVLFVSFKVHTY